MSEKWVADKMSEKRIADKMSEKRVADNTVHDSESSLTIQTVQKWVTAQEKELTTMVWLTYDRLDRDPTSALKYKVLYSLISS